MTFHSPSKKGQLDSDFLAANPARENELSKTDESMESSLEGGTAEEFEGTVDGHDPEDEELRNELRRISIIRAQLRKEDVALNDGDVSSPGISPVKGERFPHFEPKVEDNVDSPISRMNLKMEVRYDDRALALEHGKLESNA